MLAPEALFFKKRIFTEKKCKATNVAQCISEKGHYRFQKDDQFEPVIVQKMSLLNVGMSSIDNDFMISLENDTEFYKVEKMPSIASFLFSRDFLKTFLLQGELFLSSHVHDHTKDDFIILSPNGQLMISVDEPLSQRLGFTEVKKFSCGNGRALLVMNLKVLLLQAGDGSKNKLLNRFRESLAVAESSFSEPYSFLWNPSDPNICPSTLAKFFHENGVGIEEVPLKITTKSENLFISEVPNVPLADDSMCDENDFDFDSFEDWMGGVFNGLNK